MKVFGFEISRATQKASPPSPVYGDRGGWFPLIRESFTGAWQRNITVDRNSVMSFHAVFACMTLIASDISKLRPMLVGQSDGIWTETNSAAFSPVLRKPNRIQTRIQFYEAWVLSKLSRGNTYVLKVRDNRGVVIALYVLDPAKVKPMLTDEGDLYYQLVADNTAGLTEDILVPASEIIHDRFNCLFHPLIGISPLFAAGVSATQGLNIQNNSAWFFGNRSQPGGVLTAPGRIEPETAARLKASWEEKFSGENAGKVAVLGDGLTYERMSLSAQESQLIEQLKWTAEVVCSTFHVPPYKIGMAQAPAYTNIQALNVEYYSQCLQALLEAIELCLDEGLGLDSPKEDGRVLGVEFDVDGLLRMDSVTQMEVLDKASGVMTIDEKRRKISLKPVPGGDAVYLQQQNYSTTALAKRDAKEDPFAKTGDGKVVSPPAADNDDEALELEAAKTLVAMMKGFR